MDQIKPPKNLVLSRESMNAALDALRAGRRILEATEEVARVISSRTVSRPPAPTSSRAPKLSSRSTRSSRPSSRNRPSSASQSSQAPKSTQVAVPRKEGTPQITVGSVEDIELVREDLAVPSEGISEEVPGTHPVDVNAPEGEKETSLAGGDIQGAVTEVAPVIEGVGPSPIDDEAVAEEVGSKRPPPSNAPAPAPKRSRASQRPALALPAIGKEKAYVVPLLSAPDNDILNAEDITHQSPASVVAELIRERMFGGVTEASDPRLLALIGLLASSTREQAAFRSRPRGELGDIIREMLLMVMGLFMEVDARDHTLQESVDRRVEEAHLEENLSATSDAQSNLAAAREHSKSLQAELTYALDALKRADEKAAEADIRCKEALKQLSSLEEVQRERDEVRHQYEALKADFEAAQFQHKAVMAQREEVLARVVVLEQELVKRAESFKDLTLEAETTRLQNQYLSQEVEALKKRCSALLEDAKLAEDRVQLECEERLREYKESPELKKEIQQAGEDYLQDYKNSFEFRAEMAEACERRLAEYKASDEMKIAEDSDGEDVIYGEDDRPLPKGAFRAAVGPSEADIELDGEEVEVFEPEGDDDGLQEKDVELGEEGTRPQGQEVVLFVGTGGSERGDARPPIDSNVNIDSVNDSDVNVDDNAPRHVSPLRTDFPSVE
ncbi:uncharacterized protein LOC122723864 [Manihot esculenta]|uniref:uncharacterized protein LOC122723864 n=1 Tax=Manihot esculenta TaxID=3983 RepID=UPI001CC6AA04|nr:uncharacterized protein LOC122723864 [Manihot esculenta]